MIDNRRRRERDPGRKRQVRPLLEGLEDRMLLYATTGGAWTYGSRITYSFAPDGTSVGGVGSTLNTAMNARGFSTATWQEAIKKAAGVWQAVANINLAQVADSGAPLGVAGNQQNDPRFGDIRIVGVPSGTGTLAGAYLPPPFNGGTLAGDIVFNTGMSWQIGSNYDLQTVAIHEIGHALGMDHSTIDQADMYAAYNGIKQSLNADDTNGIRSIYSARQPDYFDYYYPNSTINITPSLNSQGQLAWTGLDVNNYYDEDWYYVVAPQSTSNLLTVTAQATNLSSLSPRVTLFNSAGVGVADVAAPLSYGGTATTSVGGATPGQAYYIRVTAASSGPSGSGAYGLIVNFSSTPIGPLPPPNTTVAQQPDRGGGSANESTGGPRANGNGEGLLTAPGQLKKQVGGMEDPLDGAISCTTLCIGDLKGWGDRLDVSPENSVPKQTFGAGDSLQADTPVIDVVIGQYADDLFRRDNRKH